MLFRSHTHIHATSHTLQHNPTHLMLQLALQLLQPQLAQLQQQGTSGPYTHTCNKPHSAAQPHPPYAAAGSAAPAASACAAPTAGQLWPIHTYMQQATLCSTTPPTLCCSRLCSSCSRSLRSSNSRAPLAPCPPSIGAANPGTGGSIGCAKTGVRRRISC